MDIGNRIFTKFDRPDRALVEKFAGWPSSNINDMMNRLFCMREDICRIGKHEKQLLGTAFTVKVPDGDNVFIHKALDLAEDGDVLVIDGNGCTSRSLMGEIMFTYAQNKGIRGIIVDGAIRAGDRIRMMACGKEFEVTECGAFTPGGYNPIGELTAGDVGYIAASIKDIADIRVGDTITVATRPAPEPLPGYKDILPMIYSGIYPINPEDYKDLREALEKLRLFLENYMQ